MIPSTEGVSNIQGWKRNSIYATIEGEAGWPLWQQVTT